MKEIFTLRTSANSQEEHLFLHNGANYRVLNEFEVDNKHYALMGKHDESVDDFYLFHIHQNKVRDIEDEHEWDRVVEAIDQYYS